MKLFKIGAALLLVLASIGTAQLALRKRRRT
jgi:hypothetical protein